MPVVALSEHVFEDLATLRKWAAAPTPDALIGVLVRDEMERIGLIPAMAQTEVVAACRPEPEMTEMNLKKVRLVSDPAEVGHSKPIRLILDGRPKMLRHWTDVIDAAIGIAADKGLRGASLAEALGEPACPGPLKGRGFRFIEDRGISVQGQCAPDACRMILRLARRYNHSVEVLFRWNSKKTAAFRGEIGQIRLGRHAPEILLNAGRQAQ